MEELKQRMTDLWPTTLKIVVTMLITASVTYGYTEGSRNNQLHRDLGLIGTDTKVILERMTAYDRRLMVVESAGSTPLQRHVDLDNEREVDVKARVADLRADFGQRIGNITSLLEKMVTQQTELIAYLRAKESKP